MDIRFSHKIEDFEEILEIADKLAPRRHAIRFALVCIGAFVLTTPFITSTGPTHPDAFLLGMAPLAVCLIACALLQNPRRIARKYYGCEIQDIEYQAIIVPDGVTTVSPTGRAEMRWAAFSRVIEGPNALALVEKTVMYIFPRRAFSPEQWAEFLSLARERVPTWNGRVKSLHLL